MWSTVATDGSRSVEIALASSWKLFFTNAIRLLISSITRVIRRRRPLTHDEVQALFDAAMLGFCYAYGLRRSELCGIDLVDLRSNAKAPNDLIELKLVNEQQRKAVGSRAAAPEARRDHPTTQAMTAPRKRGRGIVVRRLTKQASEDGLRSGIANGPYHLFPPKLRNGRTLIRNHPCRRPQRRVVDACTGVPAAVLAEMARASRQLGNALVSRR